MKGTVLKWARNERRLSIEAAAKLLGITPAQLAARESDEAKISVSELRDMAKKYEISFASLLMPEPLPSSTRPPVTDFRTREGGGALYDQELMVELEIVNEQIELLADLFATAPDLFGGRPLARVGLQDNAERIAGIQRQFLDLPLASQFGFPTDRFLFLVLRAKIEAVGIFVQSRNLGPPKSCRGFSMLDERGIPAIVVNSNKEEEYGPRNFTLLHEYAHILLRQTGISDENRTNAVERFCNQFAAFFLMPRNAFVDEAKLLGIRTWNDAAVGKLAKRFKVSKSSVAIHLEDVGLAKKGLYDALTELWKGRERKPRKGGQPTTYADKMIGRLGVRQVKIVLTALNIKKISELDAYEMLDVSAKHFGDLEREARERIAVYGGGG